MLDYKQIHLLIEQGVNGIGLFTEQANLHEQVDLVINHIVRKHIRDLKDKPVNTYSTLEKDLMRFLTTSTKLPLTYNGRYYTVDRPQDFKQLSGSLTELGNCDCVDLCCHDNDATSCSTCSNSSNDIKEEGYYIAITNVKYKNIWYKPKQIFRGEFGSNKAYGTYEKLGIKERANIETTIDSLESFSLSALVKNSYRPLLAWDQNKFYIYYKSCGGNKEFPLNLTINYTKEFTDTLSISWCDKRTLGFPTDIQTYYIDLTIAYLATINKQDQQNIVNLKSETI